MEVAALDSYSLKARYYPTVVVISPLCLLILSVSVGCWDLVQSLGVAAVSTLGLAFVMDQVGRDQGKKKENGLFRQWGGKPTTRILRHRDSCLDRPTLRRYHERLGRLVKGVRMPTAGEEAEDAAAADSIYESCASFLRERTRDKKAFRLIFQENANYGFRRNLWGMKPAGVFLAAVAPIVCSGISAWYLVNQMQEWWVAAICAVISTVLLVLWVVRFKPSWVRTPADEYARQLVSACDALEFEADGK